MAYQRRKKRFRSSRPRYRRKLRQNRPFASTVFGTRCAGRTFLMSPTADAGAMPERRDVMARRSRRSRPEARSSGWKSCGRRCAPVITGHVPSCACGFRRAMAASVRSASRRFGTGWRRWRCCWCSARFSRRTCCPTSTGSVRGWMPNWRYGGPTGTSGTMGGPRWLMLISATISPRSRTGR